MGTELSDDALEALRFQADPEADEVAAELLSSGDLGGVNALLRTYARNGDTPSEALPPSLREFLLRNAKLPDDLDRARIERASRFFVDHGMSIGVILGLPSLLECYTASRGVKALHATDKMGYSGAAKRVGDTAQFVVHVMAPGGLLDPNGKGVPTLLKVRLMHAASRLLIERSGWDRAALGVPICQEDLVATLLTFGYTPLVKLPRIGVRVTDADRADFLYFWRVAAGPLGVRSDLVPEGFDAAAECFDAICRHQQGTTPEGVDLARTLLQVYADLVPGRALDGIVPGLARYLTGDAVCDALEVPRSAWTGVLRGGSFVFELFQGAQARSRLVNDLVNKLGWAQLNRLSVRFSGGHSAEFDIPAELRRAWRLPPAGSAARLRALLAATAAQLHGEAGRDVVIDLAVLVADADGEIDAFEAAALADVMRAAGVINAPDATADEAIAARARALRAGGREPASRRLANELADANAVDAGLTVAIAMAYANSGIATEERAVLDGLALALGLSAAELDARVEALVRRVEAVDAGGEHGIQ